MSGNFTSMAVGLEDEVKRLNAENRLRWKGAINHANYYHESTTNGFYDGLAACLDALADRYEWVKQEGANSAHFIRNAAHELWSLAGDSRRWKDAERLPLAVALQALTVALEIESRRIVEQHDPPDA